MVWFDFQVPEGAKKRYKFLWVNGVIKAENAPACQLKSKETVMDAEPSPCIRICSIEETTGFCLGCGRTLREVAQWSRLGGEKQRAIKAELPARLALLQAQGLTDDWKA